MKYLLWPFIKVAALVPFSSTSCSRLAFASLSADFGVAVSHDCSFVNRFFKHFIVVLPQGPMLFDGYN